MRKIILLALVIAAAFGAGWMADNAGDFQLNWLGWQIEGSVAFLIVAIIVTSAFIWFVLHLLNALMHLPGDMQKERQRLLSTKGIEEITSAMIAASESDIKAAKKHLDKARNLLPNSPLPRLLQLQLAGREKDKGLAHQQFLKLQDFTATEPLALRGLAEQALSAGDLDNALLHVEALLEVAPKQASTRRLAIDIFSYHRRWQEALKIVKQSYADGHLSADAYKRTKATIAMQQAATMLSEKNRQSAMAMLKKACTADPSLQPAAIKYTELLKQIGKISEASKVLKKTWKHAPQPEIVEAYNSLYSDLSTERQIKKARELAKQNPNALETQILLADTAMKSEKWDNAKNYIKIGLSKQNTVTLCRQMAKLYKRGYHNEAEERKWLEKAVTAIPDASWHCTNCNVHRDDWHAHCNNCHDFASIYWLPETFATA